MPDDKRRKILVVEDNDGIRRIMEATLTAHDYEVHGVSGAQHALLYAEIEVPDLILLDIGLHGMVNGWEVLRRLKANEQTAAIPVIIATALQDESSLRWAQQAGAVDYLAKPSSVDELLMRVERALASRSMTAEEEMSGEL